MPSPMTPIVISGTNTAGKRVYMELVEAKILDPRRCSQRRYLEELKNFRTGPLRRTPFRSNPNLVG